MYGYSPEKVRWVGRARDDVEAAVVGAGFAQCDPAGAIAGGGATGLTEASGHLGRVELLQAQLAVAVRREARL